MGLIQLNCLNEEGKCKFNEWEWFGVILVVVVAVVFVYKSINNM